ncbi:hypothetical protein [Vibrio barjaei]|nr:hypothetical protein [Vibrio barjaei]MCY9870422.1 hypothetical protein [Vibrio barjaei]
MDTKLIGMLLVMALVLGFVIERIEKDSVDCEVIVELGEDARALEGKI